MAVDVATREVPAEVKPTHDGAAEVSRSAEELFEWSGYVHVGGGASECPNRETGECGEFRHFHAWVHLPNAYQVRDIGDKARAARARKVRTLKDPASDASAVLDGELDDLRDEEGMERLIKLLAQRAVEKGLLDVVAGMQKDERFEHHAQDAEEYARLQGVPEDERDAEEYARLQADMLAYADELQKVFDKRQAQEEAQLKRVPADEVIALERKERVRRIADEVYLHTYYTWAIYACVLVPVADAFPTERVFKDPEALKRAPREVVVALRSKIRTLEERTTVRGDAAGN
jgi:hypothetical protein